MSNPSSASQGGGQWYTPEELKEALDLPTTSQGGLDLEMFRTFDEWWDAYLAAHRARFKYLPEPPAGSTPWAAGQAAWNAGQAVVLARLSSLERVREAAVLNTQCWLDIDPDEIGLRTNADGDCPGCALRAALADEEKVNG